MNSPATDPLADAVAMMKQGRPLEIVHAHLVTHGVDHHTADGIIDRLLAFKRQADALDPNRLREEAKWMLFQGATIEHVVEQFVAKGIAADAARPEVERIAAVVREMRPCDRCRSPNAPKDLYFDTTGNSICKRCRSIDDIGTADRRVVENVLGSLGMAGIAAQLSMSPEPPGRLSERPYCSRCRVLSGTHVNALHPAHRAQVHPGWQYVCGHCLQGIL